MKLKKMKLKKVIIKRKIKIIRKKLLKNLEEFMILILKLLMKMPFMFLIWNLIALNYSWVDNSNNMEKLEWLRLCMIIMINLKGLDM